MADIDAIRARCEAATPGEWKEEPNLGGVPCVIAPSQNRAIAELYRAHDGQSCVDADFIAHARQDIPALLAEVDRLREAQRWIPVSERLPELRKPILMCDQDGEITIGKYRDEILPYGGYENRFCKKGVAFRFNENAVTHWMSLPELPEGEE